MGVLFCFLLHAIRSCQGVQWYNQEVDSSVTRLAPVCEACWGMDVFVQWAGSDWSTHWSCSHVCSDKPVQAVWCCCCCCTLSWKMSLTKKHVGRSQLTAGLWHVLHLKPLSHLHVWNMSLNVSLWSISCYELQNKVTLLYKRLTVQL